MDIINFKGFRALCHCALFMPGLRGAAVFINFSAPVTASKAIVAGLMGKKKRGYSLSMVTIGDEMIHLPEGYSYFKQERLLADQKTLNTLIIHRGFAPRAIDDLAFMLAEHGQKPEHFFARLKQVVTIPLVPDMEGPIWDGVLHRARYGINEYDMPIRPLIGIGDVVDGYQIGPTEIQWLPFLGSVLGRRIKEEKPNVKK